MQSDRVPEGFSVQPRNFPVTLLNRAFKVCKCLIDFPETGVDGGGVNGRHVSFAACLLQFGQNFPSLLQLPSPPIDESQTRISPDAVADFCRMAESKNGWVVIALVSVRES